MRSSIIIVLLIYFSQTLIAQKGEVIPEQIAFEFLMDSITIERFGKVAIEFQECTLKQFTYWHYGKCKIDKAIIEDLVFNIPKEDSIQLPINTKTYSGRLKKIKPKSKRLKMNVYRARNILGDNYVMITIFRNDHFVHYYLIIIDSNSKVVKYCLESAII